MFMSSFMVPKKIVKITLCRKNEIKWPTGYMSTFEFKFSCGASVEQASQPMNEGPNDLKISTHIIWPKIQLLG